MLKRFQERFKFGDVVSGFVNRKFEGVQLNLLVKIANKGSAAILLVTTAIKEIGAI